MKKKKITRRKAKKEIIFIFSFQQQIAIELVGIVVICVAVGKAHSTSSIYCYPFASTDGLKRIFTFSPNCKVQICCHPDHMNMNSVSNEYTIPLRPDDNDDNDGFRGIDSAFCRLFLLSSDDFSVRERSFHFQKIHEVESS